MDGEKEDIDQILEAEKCERIESLRATLDDECAQAMDHLNKMRLAARELNASRRAIKKLEEMSLDLCGFQLWMLDFGRDKGFAKAEVYPKAYSEQEIEEMTQELAFAIEDWAKAGEDLASKLSAYIAVVKVSLDAAGHVVDGYMMSEDGPLKISPQGVVGSSGIVCYNHRISCISFTSETSRKMLDLLRLLYDEGVAQCLDLSDSESEDEEE